AGAALQWSATLHHNDHLHPDYFQGEGATADLIFPDHGENSYLELCLTATDSAGLTGQNCVDLRGGTAQTGVAAPVAAAAAPEGVGRILRERWTGVGGNTVADLTHSPGYPDRPDQVDYPTELDLASAGKDYGQRLRGLLLPPVNGEYRFWIASDDSSELWLSSDADPANARLIASVATWTGRHQWEQSPSQLSAPVQLQAGERYYLEIRHKQADQKDNLSVAWQIPGQERTVIGGAYLAPWSR
ncbi:MAG TPA: PA14 domain-containing protein, partial [Caldilineaceae bacterium]|nr:PA14 domain-containing protein [Caldilineaceae bacterium]